MCEEEDPPIDIGVDEIEIAGKQMNNYRHIIQLNDQQCYGFISAKDAFTFLMQYENQAIAIWTVIKFKR